MAEESKVDDPVATQKAVKELVEEPKNTNAQVESEDEDEGEGEGDAATAGTDGASSVAAAKKKKKKKSKKKRIKDALGIGSGEASASGSSSQDSKAPLAHLNREQITEMLKMNPALAQNFDDKSEEGLVEAFKKLTPEEILTGLASSGKNAKDMAGYKFWSTQPVQKFDEKGRIEEEGPIKEIDLDIVRKEPYPLDESFEWVTMDMTSEDQLKEVFELLYGHYVEDDEAMFRFNYSKSFLKWALLSPEWKADWHVGVRATANRKLVAFISAVPVTLRVREKELAASEVNFLCVHKKLRSKRLTPLLIKEITRRCYLQKVNQAIYTAGVVLPKPISTCRYFHRALDWQKLYEVGFSPLPKNSKPSYQVMRYQLPQQTATKGLREMELKDVDAVTDLVRRYLAKSDMAPIFNKEEIIHWMLHNKDRYEERVVWAYVVEDPTTKKITDFFSFYCVESSVINHAKHNNVRAAYLFYYATEVKLAPKPSKDALSTRLNALINDALILAKKFKFDVFNALTLLDNNTFLENQKFGAGDGQLHFYLFNYKANPILGGVNERNEIDKKGSGVGVVML